MIELKNVIKTFNAKGKDVHAVTGVSLDIHDHEIFGIVGYSGAGKSTLVRMINLLEKQTSGEVIVDGQNLANLSAKELRQKRQKIGMIFQYFNLLWSRTVTENIELPLEFAKVSKVERKSKAQELIRLVGLEGKENAYPSELSGGQKQRVGIARALANDPTILLCDEATSALDPDTTDSILDLLDNINRTTGITIVMITHQMEVVQKICHRMAVMSDGKVVEIGAVKDIFENPCHEITKKFVQNSDSGGSLEKLRRQLKKQYPYGQILRLNFMGEVSNRPVLQKVISEVEIPVSIVNANIHQGQSGPMGVIYAHVSDGTQKQYDHFIELMAKEGVKVEVL